MNLFHDNGMYTYFKVVIHFCLLPLLKEDFQLYLGFTRSKVDKHDEKPKVDKLSLKKKGIGSEARAERMANTDADLQLLGEAERERHLQKQKKRRRQGHEDEVYVIF